MKKHQGFTLIEVALFIALSGLILMGVIISTGNAISQQHYNDSVQNFADFLRGLYSEVSDPKSAGDGRSDYAVYGKLVTFGETESNGVIYTYDVIGEADGDLGDSDVLAALLTLKASPIIKSEDPDNPGEYITTYAGFEENYTPTWNAKISLVKNSGLDRVDKGALLIVRSPMSGVIYTFAMSGKTVEVRKAIGKAIENSSTTDKIYANPLTEFLKSSEESPADGFATADGFTIADLDFCLKSEDAQVFNNADRNIRIQKNSHNSSGVVVIDVSADIGYGEGDSRCKN